MHVNFAFLVMNAFSRIVLATLYGFVIAKIVDEDTLNVNLTKRKLFLKSIFKA